jgi:hypothetical protein
MLFMSSIITHKLASILFATSHVFNGSSNSVRFGEYKKYYYYYYYYSLTHLFFGLPVFLPLFVFFWFSSDPSSDPSTVLNGLSHQLFLIIH